MKTYSLDIKQDIVYSIEAPIPSYFKSASGDTYFRLYELDNYTVVDKITRFKDKTIQFVQAMTPGEICTAEQITAEQYLAILSDLFDIVDKQRKEISLTIKKQ